jgi:hypothetical protein
MKLSFQSSAKKFNVLSEENRQCAVLFDAAGMAMHRDIPFYVCFHPLEAIIRRPVRGENDLFTGSSTYQQLIHKVFNTAFAANAQSHFR